MSFLTAAVVFVGLLCAIDLLLTLAVIRRLGDHDRRLAVLRPPHPPFPSAGTPLGAFAATSTDGQTVSLDEPTVVAVFSTACSACTERLPEFGSFLETAQPARTLVLVVGERAEAEEFATGLPGSLPVVIEPRNGPMSKALRVPAFPSFYLVADGTIAAAAGSPAELPMAATT